MESFLDKGRMKSLLEAIPVKIVLNDDSGLIGAARFTLYRKHSGQSEDASRRTSSHRLLLR